MYLLYLLVLLFVLSLGVEFDLIILGVIACKFDFNHCTGSIMKFNSIGLGTSIDGGTYYHVIQSSDRIQFVPQLVVCHPTAQS